MGFESTHSTKFITEENIYMNIQKKKDCVITEASITAMSPHGGVMSDYFIVVAMEKYSRNG